MSEAKTIKKQDIEYTLSIPSFLVAAMPSPEGQPLQNANIYFVINNKKGSSPLRGAEIEMDINKGRTTKYVDYVGNYTVSSGEIFMTSKSYDLRQLPEGTYDLTGKLKISGVQKRTSNEELRLSNS